MKDQSKTKQALIQELTSLREKITELEQSESERKRAEEALRLHSEILAHIVESVHLVRVDDGVIIYTNQRFDSVFGYDPGELVGKHVSIINAPGEKSPEAVANEIIRSLKQAGGVWNGEVHNIRKDGYSFWCHANVSTFKHPQYGELWISVNRDITERKQAEEALREGEGRLRFHTDNSPMAVVEWNTDFVVTRWTGAAEKMFGWSFEETVGRPIIEIRMIYEEDIPIVQSVMQRLTDGKSKHVVSSNRNYTKKGAVIHCEWYNSVLYDSAGKMISVMSQVLDITERKRAEEALRESEGKYREIIENMQEGYHEVDIKGNFTFFNESMRKIIGYEREELLGMNNRQYADEENTRKVYKVYNRVYRTGEPVKNFEWQIIRKDGDRRDIEVSISLIRDTGGQPTGFRGIVRDITERKIMEDALRKSEEQYRSLVESTKDSIYLLDRDLRYLFANNAYLERVGFTLQQLIGRTYSELHTFPSDSFPGYVNHVFETGESTEFEYKSFRDNKPFLRTLSPVRGEQGETIAITVISKDVTHLKKAENSLREYQGQLRALTGRIQAAREEERI
ncbi:MAG: PAS domain S-box protein, partial [Deltaproteobacteria bacterium]|nr:PAS domain S-box protein [Deltaproteobacteria bacterium]